MTRPPRDALPVQRAAVPADWPAIEALLRVSLGKQAETEYAEFLRWKHRQNPFGDSPTWVATHRDQIVAVRAFLRWDFRRTSGEIVHAVRAVDTATDPAFRGRGIFNSLTTHAIAALQTEIDFVFNTPNDKSGPGYLKMGWRVLGAVPSVLHISPKPAALLRLARRTSSTDFWGLPTQAGMPIDEALADAGLRALLERPRGELETNRTSDFLRWRYGFAPLGYRVMASDSGRGLAVFRLRRRGKAVEAAVQEVHAVDDRGAKDALQAVTRATAADYLLRLGCDGWNTRTGVTTTRQGPVVYWRPMCWTQPPTIGPWQLQLGDVELF